MKYRKKPVVVDAFQCGFSPKEIPTFLWCAIEEGVIESVKIKLIGNSFIETKSQSGTDVLKIKTLEGDMYAFEGDYIIRGIENELYPCKPDIFHKTYELVGD